MILHGSDPDVQTIVRRIGTGDIKLQPNFQRGEVWGDSKKRRLIDSILRDWHVPPIHVVKVKETAIQEVLDGQQRLVAIRDFAEAKLSVDGYTDPYDPEIQKLDGLTYHNLPDVWRRRFDQFTIRLFVVSDYQPGEPGELFYRLNQPTNLTAAEQRNAFFGPARQQVKDLVNLFEQRGLSKSTIGFTNSRMAYDDVLAKLCMTLDNRTLLLKVTANSVTEKYRAQVPFSEDTMSRVANAVELLSNARGSSRDKVKFNKATLFSWLLFLTGVHSLSATLGADELGAFIAEFEAGRTTPGLTTYDTYRAYLLNEFNDRASSRVSDVSSVILRDVILWVFFVEHTDIGEELLSQHPSLDQLRNIAMRLKQAQGDYEVKLILDELVDTLDWGRSL